MGQYRLLLMSTVFLLPLCATAVESAKAPEQNTSSEAVRRHHEHSADRVRQEDASGEESSSQAQATQTKEKKSVAGEMEDHHHHHEPVAGDKAGSQSPPEEEGKHRHPMMDREGKMPAAGEMEGHQHHMMGMGEHHMMKMGPGGQPMHMDMDVNGMVMNENKDVLPRDCPELAGDVEITVRAGVKYAQKFPGTVFGYDKHEWHVKPCSRITITFINEDKIRHQWMVHMLPKYIYPRGMFHIEVSGPGRRTGTFIVPSIDKTYFVHCDIAQHTEKGMKAQLVVGSGDQDFPSIPGITAPNFPDSYEKETSWSTIGFSFGAGIIGLALVIVGLGRVQRKAGAEETSQVRTATPVSEVKQKKGWLFGRK